VHLELTVVDAFTDHAFAGNPAAVAILEAFPDEDVMHAVAREMSLSETAFVVARDDGDHDLRWFTPSVEMDLCGHATLASAHVLGSAVRFHTRSGILSCTPGEGGWIEMDFPAESAREADAPADFDLPGTRWFGRGKQDVLVELADADSVRAFQPDLAKLAGWAERLVIVTAPGDRAGIDCVSRVFAPNVGIPEDPVTGGAHCMLALFWGDRLGRDALVGEQASERGGIVRMRRSGDRVILGGQAVTVEVVRLDA
jgi:predicted PhzF superfamily epimerase YddE/YHI9